MKNEPLRVEASVCEAMQVARSIQMPEHVLLMFEKVGNLENPVLNYVYYADPDQAITIGNLMIERANQIKAEILDKKLGGLNEPGV